jgi:hypothetical protein
MRRHPRYDPQLRDRALAAYREHGSYRKAAAAIGRSPKRTRELVREGLRLEMAAAQKGSA